MEDERKQHRSFWDCYELETYEQVEVVHLPGAGGPDRVEIHECTECGALFGCEKWDDHPTKDFNWFGFKDSATVESIKESYNSPT